MFDFENAHHRNFSLNLFFSFTLVEIGTRCVRPSQYRQSCLIKSDVGFSWSLPLIAWLPLRTDWTTDPQTESWSGAGAPEDYWAAGSRQQTFNPFGLSVGGEMLGTTSNNNPEVMFCGDHAVHPGVKFVLQTGTVNLKVPHMFAFTTSPAGVAAGQSQDFKIRIPYFVSGQFSKTIPFLISTTKQI